MVRSSCLRKDCTIKPWDQLAPAHTSQVIAVAGLILLPTLVAYLGSA